MNDFDSPWKDVLDELFEPFMVWFFPTAHADIDWSRGYESLDKELQQVFPDSELGKKFIDKLVKVWLKDGMEEWVLVHIEVQTQKEHDFERRMFVYNYRLYDRYNRDVVTLVILSDDNPTWRPHSFVIERWGFLLRMKFPAVKLLDYVDRKAELAEDSNLFALVVLAHLEAIATHANPALRKSQKLELVRNLLRRGWSNKDIRAIFRFIDWILSLPDALKQQFRHEVLELKEKKTMPFISDLEEYLLEQGFQKGLEKGIEKGIEKAREESARARRSASQEAWMAAIELRLRSRFPQQADEILAKIQKWDDQNQLRSLFKAIDMVASVEELGHSISSEPLR